MLSVIAADKDTYGDIGGGCMMTMKMTMMINTIITNISSSNSSSSITIIVMIIIINVVVVAVAVDILLLLLIIITIITIIIITTTIISRITIIITITIVVVVVVAILITTSITITIIMLKNLLTELNCFIYLNVSHVVLFYLLGQYSRDENIGFVLWGYIPLIFAGVFHVLSGCHSALC